MKLNIISAAGGEGMGPDTVADRQGGGKEDRGAAGDGGNKMRFILHFFFFL